ncbi:MAG: SIMPL domain-containing protein, partial [Longimicrobiales bacterium]|nr:SIMPL domain-containing protein [Longimicrobiales bacterium]
ETVRQEGTGIGGPAAMPVPVTYGSASSGKEEFAVVARPPSVQVAYPVGSIIGGRGGEGFFPSVAPLIQAQGLTGITVQGFGRATSPADAARVQFSVGAGYYGGPYPLPYPEKAPPGSMEPGMPGETTVSPEVMPATPTPPTPLTKESLAPLIDAIKAQGISDADIEVTIYPGSYYGPYGPGGNARIAVNLRDVGKVGALVDAVNAAVPADGSLFIQNVSVLYTVGDCDALLRQARTAAIEDARDNGRGLAEALGVSLGDILGAAEYSYSPYGPSPCDPTFEMSYYGAYGYEGPGYDPAMPAEVQVVSTISLAFAIK